MYDPSRPAVWRRRWNRALDLVFQPDCLGCGALADGGLRNLSLCSTCRQSLETLRSPRCSTCGRALHLSRPLPEYRCPPCRAKPPPFDRLTAVWAYQPPLDASIRAFKYGRLTGLAQPLGRALARCLRNRGPAIDAVVPVPLHWRRRIARGFDQSALLARQIAAALDLPFLAALRRRRATPPQSTQPLTRRRANIALAFGARPGVSIAGRRILLVDDVVTSGATMAAAALALRRAGAARIEAAVVARTPSPGTRPAADLAARASEPRPSF